MIKEAIINNLFLDTPVYKKGKVLQQLDFFRSLSGDKLFNPKHFEHLFAIMPLKGNKVWIHYYKFGTLTAVGLYIDGEIKKANLHLLKFKAVQLMDMQIDINDYNILLDCCEAQLKELSTTDIYNLWNNGTQDEPFTMTHLRTVLASLLLGPGTESEYCNTLTTVQDRLPNAGVVNAHLNWSDKIYNNKELMAIIDQYSIIEQTSLF